MDIRRARPDDVSGICRIEGEVFSDPWGEKDIFSYICQEGGMCYTALDEGEPIGYIIGRKIPPEGEIYRIAVDPKYRRRGIGFRLLSYAMRCERGSGVETVFLEVRSKNTPARALYRSYGFNEVGIRKGYYQNPTDDAVVMIHGGSC